MPSLWGFEPSAFYHGLTSSPRCWAALLLGAPFCGALAGHRHFWRTTSRSLGRERRKQCMVGIGGGVEWQQLHWSSVLQGSSGYLWFCLRRKKYIYEDKNLKADFSCYRKTNIKYYPCPCNHAVSVCASLQVMGWYLLRMGKIQQAAPLTRGMRASTSTEGPHRSGTVRGGMGHSSKAGRHDAYAVWVEICL